MAIRWWEVALLAAFWAGSWHAARALGAWRRRIRWSPLRATLRRLGDLAADDRPPWVRP